MLHNTRVQVQDEIPELGFHYDQPMLNAAQEEGRETRGVAKNWKKCQEVGISNKISETVEMHNEK